MEPEDLYIVLFEDFAPGAEYLQADSEHRNFLPEAVIIAGLAFVMGAFAKSFFGELGEAAGEGLIKRIRAAFAKSEEKSDARAMVEGLELMAPFLHHLGQMSEGQREIYRDSVAGALARRGFPEDVAKRTSSDLIASLAAAGGKGPA